MDAPNGLVGQTFAVEFCPQQSATFFEICVELLDISCGQLVQLDTSESRDDVLIDPALIGHLGVGAEVCFLISLVPEVQPVP